MAPSGEERAAAYRAKQGRGGGGHGSGRGGSGRGGSRNFGGGRRDGNWGGRKFGDQGDRKKKIPNVFIAAKVKYRTLKKQSFKE